MSARAKPLATTLTMVDAGDPISLPCSDSIGWMTRKAPCAGVLVEWGDTAAFVSWRDLRALKRKRRRNETVR